MGNITSADIVDDDLDGQILVSAWVCVCVTVHNMQCCPHLLMRNPAQMYYNSLVGMDR